MKSQLDLVRGLLAKAQSDLDNLEVCTAHEVALDTACYHAQQAAEKILKAYLTHVGAEYPYTHNLAQLVDLCAKHDEEFVRILDDAAALTPYAVEARYDTEFWPSLEDARAAKDAATRIRKFCHERINTE